MVALFWRHEQRIPWGHRNARPNFPGGRHGRHWHGADPLLRAAGYEVHGATRNADSCAASKPPARRPSWWMCLTRPPCGPRSPASGRAMSCTSSPTWRCWATRPRRRGRAAQCAHPRRRHAQPGRCGAGRRQRNAGGPEHRLIYAPQAVRPCDEEQALDLTLRATGASA